MIRLARLSIRRPRAALTFWAIFAVVLALLGLGVSDSLSPSISVVPGSESSRAQAALRVRIRPVRLGPSPVGGTVRSQLDRQGPKLVVELGKRDDTRVMSAWSPRRVGERRCGPRPDAAMIVLSVARSEKQMVETVQLQVERTVDRVLTGAGHRPTSPASRRSTGRSSTRRSRRRGRPELIAVARPLRAPADRAAHARRRLRALRLRRRHDARRLRRDGVAWPGDRAADPLAVALASITGLLLGVGFSLLMVDRFREEELTPPMTRRSAPRWPPRPPSRPPGAPSSSPAPR